MPTTRACLRSLSLRLSLLLLLAILMLNPPAIAAPILGSTLFTETFSDGSMARWTSSPLGLAANWSIQAGRLRYNGGGHTQLYAGSASWKNYMVQTRFRLDSQSNYPGGLRGRVEAATGRSYVAWIYPAQSMVRLFRTTAWNIDSPGLAELANASVAPITAGLDHTLAMSFAGDSIEVYLDGVKVLEAQDSALASGQVALDVSSQPIEFDDITVWSVAAPVPADEGPGGPLLVIGNKDNPFSRYLTEILDAEGLRSYSAKDISKVNATTLAAYDVVLLDEVALTAAQVQMLTTWVTAGGNLIAMRPDPKLAGLLGITYASGTITNGYMKVAPTAPVGTGLVNNTRLQFHGTADKFRLAAGSGAVNLGYLYSAAASTDSFPGVTLRPVGTAGGQAAAFAYGLSRSVVLTRQGNPAWAGQDRDGNAPVRSDDLFYGNSVNDPKPDWNDFSLIQIPQADEQQRLLRKMIAHMALDRKPLPSFWYLPRKLKAVVVMTGDDHAHNGTDPRFRQYMALSPVNCSVEKWECIRGTSYVFYDTPLADVDAASFNAKGFEVALHVNTGCATATQPLMEEALSKQLPEFKKNFPSLPAPTTNRNHCIAWANYASPAVDQRKYGIRLDTNYYYWPEKFVQDRPGLFTGSGMPMRFAHSDGTKIDVYQAATQLTDEANIDYTKHITTLLDNALGAKGFYAVITANMHTDQGASVGSDAIVQAAIARKVPVITAKQLLDWLDVRNKARFSAIQWKGGVMSFQIADVSSTVPGLQAMVPSTVNGLTISTIKRNGGATPIAFSTMVVKGVSYAFFAGLNGSYEIQYK